MKKMCNDTSRYVPMGEYFNRTPDMLDHQGQKDKLFKRGFVKLFIENFDVKLVNYGFMWGYVYANSRIDDITWWLFEKTRSLPGGGA
jgi:hypothetical protein